jgi:hypothetical protein
VPELPEAEVRRRRIEPWLVGLLVLSLAIAFGSCVRIRGALSQANFDPTRAERMLKSDPGLLYYITHRIVEAGGLPPADFRADPRVEHPATSDLPAMFTVGQEFLVAWTYLLFGHGMPLHVFSVIVMGIVASLSVVGVYGLAVELTGRLRWGALAAALYAITPANYRTVGFILMREDLSVPLFSLHLWLLARAARRKTPASFILAAAALALALSTWHAMGFVAAIEAACLFAWFLRTGRNPLSAPRAWLFPAVLVLFSVAVPVLHAKLFLLSLPMQIAAALLLTAALERRFRWPAAVGAGVGLASWCACLGASIGLSDLVAREPASYGHVLELLWSKLRFLGTRPEDPQALSFGARILWQGPFETGSFRDLLRRLIVVLVALPVAIASAVPGWVRGRGDERVLVLMAFALVSLVAATAVSRVVILAGLVGPVAVAIALRELPRASVVPWVVGLGLVQAVGFTSHMWNYRNDRWYQPSQQDEMAGAVGWIRENLPQGGAIAADFVNSTAILAHTGHPIILQPKYETPRSRVRIERFLTGLYHGSPAELRALLRESYACRYLLIDVQILWASRYQAGLADDTPEPPPGSAAAALMSPDPRVYAQVPGFRLLYRSPVDPPLWRLYEIE